MDTLFSWLFAIFIIFLTIVTILLALFVLLRIPIAIVSIFGLIFGLIKLNMAVSDEEKSVAKKFIKWSIIGIALVLALYAIGSLIYYFNVQEYILKHAPEGTFNNLKK